MAAFTIRLVLTRVVEQCLEFQEEIIWVSLNIRYRYFSRKIAQ